MKLSEIQKYIPYHFDSSLALALIDHYLTEDAEFEETLHEENIESSNNGAIKKKLREYILKSVEESCASHEDISYEQYKDKGVKYSLFTFNNFGVVIVGPNVSSASHSIFRCCLSCNVKGSRHELSGHCQRT